MRSRVFLAVLLAAFSACAAADIYKWYDEQGRARYGERPPAGVSARRLTGPPEASTPAPPRPSVEEQDAAFRRRELERREAREREEKEAKARAQRCEMLRAELSYTENLRLFRWNEKGEKVYWTDAEKAAHAAKLRKLIAEHCP